MSIVKPGPYLYVCLIGILSSSAPAALHRPVTGDELAAALAICTDGDRFDLRDHTFSGHFRVERSVSLFGQRAVLDGGFEGTVLTLDAPNILIEGLTVRSGGTNLSGPDSGIYLTPRATGSRITSNTVEACAFGIWVHACTNVVIETNHIRGLRTGHTSNRGNGIQLFDSQQIQVRKNHVQDGRDGIYISATEDSLIEGNHMEGARYGIHYMYSYRNTVRGNVCRNNNNGYALMESKHLLVEHNVSENNKGQGLQFRDAQYCVIRDNQLIGNREGMFFYSSTNNEIVNNLVQDNEVGVKIWAGSLRNIVSGNRFIGNHQQIFYVGTTEIEWGHEGKGNYWSDYMGWDQNGDGIGERPYRVNSFSARLLFRFPSAALFMSSPSLETLSMLEQRLPLLRTPTITDRYPLRRANP